MKRGETKPWTALCPGSGALTAQRRGGFNTTSVKATCPTCGRKLAASRTGKLRPHQRREWR